MFRDPLPGVVQSSRRSWPSLVGDVAYYEYTGMSCVVELLFSL